MGILYLEVLSPIFSKDQWPVTTVRFCRWPATCMHYRCLTIMREKDRILETVLLPTNLFGAFSIPWHLDNLLPNMVISLYMHMWVLCPNSHSSVMPIPRSLVHIWPSITHERPIIPSLLCLFLYPLPIPISQSTPINSLLYQAKHPRSNSQSTSISNSNSNPLLLIPSSSMRTLQTFVCLIDSRFPWVLLSQILLLIFRYLSPIFKGIQKKTEWGKAFEQNA